MANFDIDFFKISSKGVFIWSIRRNHFGYIELSQQSKFVVSTEDKEKEVGMSKRGENERPLGKHRYIQLLLLLKKVARIILVF